MEIVCVGGANIDRKYALPGVALPQTSNPARASASFGGVARNVAENLARLGVEVALLSVVGDDADGTALLNHARSGGIDVALVRTIDGRRTTEYVAIIDGAGELVIGVNDMTLLDDCLSTELERHRADVERAQWVFLDCNLGQDVLAAWALCARGSSLRLAIDAVSEPKVVRLPVDLHGIDVVFLNDGEACAYVGSSEGDASQRAAKMLERGVGAVVLTLGGDGLIAADAKGIVHVPAVRVNAVDVTGAGDALVAATLYRLHAGDDVVAAARVGALAAALTIESVQSVRPDLSPELLRTGVADARRQ